MKSKLRLVPVLLGVMGLMLMALPAAGNTTTGGGGVQCTASLPVFPSTSEMGTCDGFAAVALDGVTDGYYMYEIYNDPAKLASGDLENFSATFDYQETCTVNEPVHGYAHGTANLDDLAGLHDDTLVTATATTEFAWTRVGLTVVVMTDNGSVTMTDSGGNTYTASSLDPVPTWPPFTSEDTGGATVAAFAPLNLPDCGDPGPVTAEVVAGALFGA